MGHQGGRPIVGHHMNTGGGKGGTRPVDPENGAPRPGPVPRAPPAKGIRSFSAGFSLLVRELSERSEASSATSGDDPRSLSTSSLFSESRTSTSTSDSESLSLGFDFGIGL